MDNILVIENIALIKQYTDKWAQYLPKYWIIILSYIDKLLELLINFSLHITTYQFNYSAFHVKLR